MEFQRIDAAPKVPELVMQSFLSSMEQGAIKIGEELPPERELAASMGVGRNSLRECMAILEYMNVIETQGNRKIVVKDVSWFQKAVTFVRASSNSNVLLDSIEFRIGMETMIVKLACERATEDDLLQLKTALSRMDENIYDHDADILFHKVLANASHNTLFATTMELLASILMDVRLHYYKMPKYHKRTQESHNRIYQAVRNRDVKEAVEAVEEHLQLVIDFTNEAIETGLLEDRI